MDIERGEVRPWTSGEVEPSFYPLGEAEPSPRGSGEAKSSPRGSGKAEPSPQPSSKAELFSSRRVRRSWPMGVGRGRTKLPSFEKEA